MVSHIAHEMNDYYAIIIDAWLRYLISDGCRRRKLNGQKVIREAFDIDESLGDIVMATAGVADAP